MGIRRVACSNALDAQNWSAVASDFGGCNKGERHDGEDCIDLVFTQSVASRGNQEPQARKGQDGRWRAFPSEKSEPLP